MDIIEDPEFGVSFSRRRFVAFHAGAEILAPYILLARDTDEEFLQIETGAIGDDMVAHVAQVYVPDSVTLVDGTEQVDTEFGGVSPLDKVALENLGWVLDDGQWRFYLSTYPDPYK
jgi:hypothetical protein